MSTSNNASNLKACRQALQLIADPVVIQIFISLHDTSEMRFNDLKRACNTNAVTLTRRLKSLEETNLVNRHEGMTDKQSVSYSLSELGQLCMPIVAAVREVAATLMQKGMSSR